MSKNKTENEKNEEMNEQMNDEQKINEAEQTESNESNLTENYEEKINALQQEINQYKELAMRKAAEFENYKRRTENDQLNLLKYAAESLIIKLLPTIDDLERSLSHMNEETDVQKIKEGVQLRSEERRVGKEC